MSVPIAPLDLPCPTRNKPVRLIPKDPHIGRYRVERILGHRGFGLVFLAHDEQLQRPVAIKYRDGWPNRMRIGED